MIENKMITCEGYAMQLENLGHNFTNKDGPTNEKRSPKRSKYGIYYMDCMICSRCVFEDGTGSANGGCFK